MGTPARIGGADGGDDRLVVGMHDDDAVDAALDHRLHLLVLAVVVHVGHRLERRPAAGLDVAGACARWPPPRTARSGCRTAVPRCACVPPAPTRAPRLSRPEDRCNCVGRSPPDPPSSFYVYDGIPSYQESQTHGPASAELVFGMMACQSRRSSSCPSPSCSLSQLGPRTEPFRPCGRADHRGHRFPKQVRPGDDCPPNANSAISSTYLAR